VWSQRTVCYGCTYECHLASTTEQSKTAAIWSVATVDVAIPLSLSGYWHWGADGK